MSFLYVEGGGSVAVFYSEDESSSNLDDAEGEEDEDSENEIEEDEEMDDQSFGNDNLDRPGTSRQGGARTSQPQHPMQWAFRHQAARSNETSTTTPATTSNTRKSSKCSQ